MLHPHEQRGDERVDMPSTTVQDQKVVSEQLLGKDGNFSAYLKFLDDLVQQDSDYALAIDSPSTNTLISSDSVLLAASVVKSNVSTTKAAMERRFREVAASNPTLRYRDKAVRMAIQAMFMVDPAAKEWHSADFKRGDYRPSSWLSEETLLDFIQRLFPPSLQGSQEAALVAVEARALKARKLQKRLGARFQLTNNLAEHLLFDERRNCLYIFHQVAFLKAHLSLYEDRPAALGVNLRESLERGTMPPQLLVETLYSIQAVLFPSIDPDSAQILDELIDKRDFDPDSAEYEGYKLFRDPPQDFKFVYWGERMAHLQNLMTRRPPRNKLERWFHRHSNEGNAFFIALLALSISIIVGVVSIGFNCVQIWITWMAWKYPTVLE